MSAICHKCQFESPDGAQHCPQCGEPLPQHLLQAGDIVCDDYKVVEILGQGGMGEVYLASHLLTEQQVAVKILAPSLAEEQDLRIRFLEEARILAKLDHPNVALLHNFRQERGRMHLVMQYVDGPSLDKILEDGPLGVEAAALLFAPLCDALGHAHDMGIVHRDLKPSNILVDQSGKPRLTDFGIAKLTVGGAELTAANARVGTSWFMSPEQGLRRPADSRSDIYSLGVSLYNALAGNLPFSGESEYEIIKGHIEKAPPAIFAPAGPREPAGPFEHEMERIVMCALHKDREQRFPTAYAFRDGLLAALSAHSSSVQLQPAGEGRAVLATPAQPIVDAAERPLTPPRRVTPARGDPRPDDKPTAELRRVPSLHTPSGRAAAPGMSSPTPGVLISTEDPGDPESGSNAE